MLELGSVTYGYPDADDVAVQGVSLTVGVGERVCLLGANGSGKSTVARLACGDLEPLAVQVLLDGTDLSQCLGRAEVSLVAQDPRCQLVSPRVWDEVAFGPRCAGLPQDEVEQRVREALAACGIAELGGRRCDELSGGQQQLLVIAAAIATRPRYLVLDEAGSLQDMPPHGQGASTAASTASGEVPRSPLVRIDVRVRLVSLVALTVGLLCVRTLVDLALACGLVGILCMLGRVRWKRAARPFRTTLPLLAFVMLAHGVRIDGTGDVAIVGSFGLSTSGLAQGGFAAMRIVLLVVLAWAYAQDLSAPELADGLARMLSPFGCLGLPVADVSMVLSVTLSFAVQVVPEFFRIELAQLARGAHFDDGPPLARLREWLAVLTPLVVLLFDRAEALARSMRLRGYRGSLSIERRRLSLVDWLFLGATAAAVAAMACR